MNKKNRFLSLLLLALSFSLLQSACKKGDQRPPIDENVDLDGSKINDSSLASPANFLLSAAIPTPSAIDLAKPVVICVHGFSACTFEWTEFRDYAKSSGDFYTSVVLLGGHGTTYEDFKSAKWENWQQPILTEYNKLRSLGYQNINIVASSTGCPLVLNMIHEAKVNTDKLKHVYFIDPIVIPANKQLSLVGVLGPVLGYTETEFESGETGFWYKYRPYQALKELEAFSRSERKALEKGITLPAGVSVKVYKSLHDGSVDPLSAVQLQKGLKTSKGEDIQVNMVQSNLHVFTRLQGRNVISGEDKSLQLKIFEGIHTEL